MRSWTQVIDTPARPLVPGFEVRRALPTRRLRMVGPFAFLDQLGPATLEAGLGLDVAPHPHIGLATLTWLFDGELLHRDSLGTTQRIRPGQVNWMTAGRGIAHSERTPPELRSGGSSLAGVQAWVALPRAQEERAPSFAHHAGVPTLDEGGARVQVIAGAWRGVRSPVAALSELVFADVALRPGARIVLPRDAAELAFYVVDGAIESTSGDGSARAGQLVLLRAGAEATLQAPGGARLVVLGGEPLGEPRFIEWNFVSSSRDRIAQAMEDWRAQRFDPVPGETERIELPDRPTVVRYP